MLNNDTVICIGDKVVDEEGLTYTVVDHGGHELACRADYGRDPLVNEYVFVIFSLEHGAWVDRDQDEPKCRLIEVI